MSDAPFAFLPLGAIVQDFKVNGRNIVLNFETQDQYAKYNGPYFGETVGRVANRISGAKVNDLNGTSYPLAANNNPNTLHGGIVGWGKRLWDGPKPIGQREIPGVQNLKGGESVEFTLVSDDGDEGFPGTVQVKIIYTTGTVEKDGKEVLVLGMDYEAELVGGADETAINMTNHSYFNLSGASTIEGTTVTLATNQHLAVDANNIPTGGPTAYPTLDTSKPFDLSATEPNVDHCFVLNSDPPTIPLDTRSEPLTVNLAAHHKGSGIHLEVLSTEPAFQFYTGQGCSVPAVDGLPARGNRAGFCCEPSRYVNACNVPEWRNMMLLKKGEKYGLRIVYKGWSD